MKPLISLRPKQRLWVDDRLQWRAWSRCPHYDQSNGCVWMIACSGEHEAAALTAAEATAVSRWSPARGNMKLCRLMISWSTTNKCWKPNGIAQIATMPESLPVSRTNTLRRRWGACNWSRLAQSQFVRAIERGNQKKLQPLLLQPSSKRQWNPIGEVLNICINCSKNSKLSSERLEASALGWLSFFPASQILRITLELSGQTLKSSNDFNRK